MWERLLDKLTQRCPLHGTKLVKHTDGTTICTACNEQQYNEALQEIDQERARSAEIANLLMYNQFLVAQLKYALINSMVRQGWTAEAATTHIESEFTEARAAEIIEMQHETQNCDANN